MRDRLLLDCSKLGIESASANTLWTCLESAYTEAHRHYHTLEHIEAMLRECDDDSPAFRLAVWFHDAVYDPRRSDNEAASAELVNRCLPDLDESTADEIKRLVIATDHREPPSDCPQERRIRDIDLLVLSRPAAEYERYAQAVRREYAHVEDAAYRAGRLKVLRHFSRQTIYRTAEFATFEAAAKSNLAQELDSLENQHS